ncbi:hypothetical protein V8E55_008453 [Tylopilus felleus]
MLSLSQIIETTNHSTFRLDMSGVVGLFGGPNAVDALETIHLYRGRRWAGWYNYPGVVDVAKTFGQMAESRLWDSVFPGPNESPAKTFNLAGKSGPDYNGAYSGTKLSTGYLGYLITEKCTDSASNPLELIKKDGKGARKTGSSAAVTIISLPQKQHARVVRSQTVTDVSAAKGKEQNIPIKPKSDPLALWAIVPSLVSIVAYVFCCVAHDLLCASLILLGILSSAFSSFVLGSATLWIRVPVPSLSSPPGDGLMFPADGNIIILQGTEADVNIITKGEFELDFPTWLKSKGRYHMVGVSSLFLMAQFLVQLLLIPRCSFFGQIMFLLSFVASGAYHLYVVSREREKVQQDILSDELDVGMEKWLLGTRTQMAVFVCLVLGDGHADPLKSNPDAVLNRIIPNETAKVAKELERFWGWDADLLHLYVPSVQVEPEDQTDKHDYSHFTEQDTRLLNDLIDDAWCVFYGYPKWRDAKSADGRVRGDSEDSQKSWLLRGGSPA